MIHRQLQSGNMQLILYHKQFYKGLPPECTCVIDILFVRKFPSLQCTAPCPYEQRSLDQAFEFKISFQRYGV